MGMVLMAPNREAFQAFLKSALPRKAGVMGVTSVTPNKISDLASHTAKNESVMSVMEISEHLPASPDLDERKAIAEVEGGVPAVYTAGFARLQLTPPFGLSIPQWLQAV